MIPARALVLALVLGLPAASAGVAHAEPARPALTGDAKAAYDQARALYAKGDYEGSLGALERAQKLSPDPRLFWNMAACEKKLGHHAKAMRHVERYLGAASGLLTDDEKREATQFLTAASAYVGRVTVTSSVEGTEVLVDDDLAGTTPLSKPIVVDQGDRRVRFVRSGYASIERSEKVAGGSELRWTVELVPEHRATPAPASTPEGPPGRDVAPPAPSSGPSRLGPVLVGGGALVVAGAGAVLVGISLSEASQIEKECGTTCVPSRWEKYRTMQTTGDVLLGVSGAALVTAVVWWILQPHREPSETAPRARTSFVLTPAGASLGATF
jgi:hypothetical protein